ncbi:MAG: trigger factor [Thermoleophilaceae bacterium]
MAAEITATRAPVDDAHVRVEVRVEANAVEREVAEAASTLAGDMKIAGFRKGKVPPAMVIQRLGRAAVLEEAIRAALPAWYEQAVNHTRVAPIGEPKLDMPNPPERGEPLDFSFEVGVLPKAKLGRHRGLEVPRRAAEVPVEEIDAEVESLRDSAAALENVDRPAQNGDFTVLEFQGRIDGEPFEGGEARGNMLELGSGRLIPGFEEQIVGARGGEQREVRVTFPEAYGAEALAGREAVFDVTVKEVKAKRLPELDEDFAAEAGGFDSVEELRQDIESRLREQLEQSVEVEYRAAVVDAAVAEATLDLPHDLIHSKAHEIWHETARRFRAQGIDPARYLEATGKTEEEVAEAAEPEAESSLSREAVIAAVAEAEGIEASDEELLDSIRSSADAHARAHDHDPPSDQELRETLEQAKTEGRDDALREDVRLRKAVDLLVEHATPTEPEAAEEREAREELWTPDKEEQEERPAGATEIWTPGS